MNSPEPEEAIGKIYRCRDADVKRISFINAELSDAARCLKTVASQLEALLNDQRSEVQPAIAKIDINGILKLLAERYQLLRRVAEANRQLRHLGASLGRAQPEKPGR
jgi:hypothetical protein